MNRVVEIRRILQETSSLVESVTSISSDVAKAVELIVNAYRMRKKVVLFGNGGSASDAEHIAGELVGKFRFDRPSLPAIALVSNPAALTAIANDFSYDHVFERAVDGSVDEGDIVFAISTSGESTNVVNGALAARRKGATVIGFCGSKGRLASLCDLALVVPSADTPRVQEVHIMLGHIICELVEEELFGGTSKRASRHLP